MDGILSDGRTGRLWLCKKKDGHALGIVVRRKAGEYFVDNLLLFREALPLEESDEKTIHLPAVRIIGFVEGTMHDIECHCGAKRTWYIGEAALERFLEGRNRVK